jgi:hypothetical protein
VLVLVARQNGKTEILVILAAFWMFNDELPLILGTSTKLEYARETWDKTRKLVERAPDLAEDIDKRWYVTGNNRIEMWTKGEASRYKIAAANEEGGRSLTIDRLLADELRQHKTYDAWNAAEPAASPLDAQIWATSNAGDDSSVVLNDLREQALAFIAWVDGTGVEHAAELIRRGECPHDYRLGLFEWSSPEDADPTDLAALAQANPALSIRKDPETLVLEARRAVAKGGQALAGFKTEKMCIRVKIMTPAIDPGKWAECLDPGDLSAARSRVAACIDVAPDLKHATLAAAAVLPDDRVRVELIESWEGSDCLAKLRAALPAIVARVKPQKLGWLPSGPAAALAADVADRRKAGRRGWPPPGVAVEEIRGEISAVCMGLAEQVNALKIAHSDDPLLNDHVGGAEPLKRGDAWVFSRKGEGHVDAAYAAAGAVHLARTLPTPLGRPRLIMAPNSEE